MFRNLILHCLVMSKTHTFTSLFFQKLRNNLINLSKDPGLALSTFEANLYEALDTANALYEDGYFEPKEGLLLCQLGLFSKLKPVPKVIVQRSFFWNTIEILQLLLILRLIAV